MTVIKTKNDEGIKKQPQSGNIERPMGEIKNTLLLNQQFGHLTSQSLGSAGKSINVKVKQADIILFTTQLSVMLGSGVVLSDALDAIAQQLPVGPFKAVVEEIAESVKGGENFSKALSVYPRIFNSMFLSIIKASEASGRMAEMLEVLSGYLNFEQETRKKIKGALTYPIIMAVMALVATGVLLLLVLPRFTKIYEAKGAALPKLTQILVDFSKLLSDKNSLAVIMTSAVAIGWMIYYWLGTESGRRAVDYLKINMPVLGTMFVDMVITRSMRIMATMINTGVSLLDTIEVIKGASRNFYFQRLWEGAIDKIHDGYQLSEAIHISPWKGLISPGIVQMIKAGEKSGKLGEVSDKISVFYEKKLEGTIKSATALIEPMMITVLGGIIGTIAIALLLPVFKISSVIAR